MQSQPYLQLSDKEILSLAQWREARGESFEGKRAVAWTIKNRVDHPCWWNQPIGANPTLWHATILKPYQISSFNPGDPNAGKWPEEVDAAFIACSRIAMGILDGSDISDLTFGSTHYFDRSISFPKAWGKESDWENTLSLGRLKFWKMKPANTHDEVNDAAVGGA